MAVGVHHCLYPSTNTHSDPVFEIRNEVKHGGKTLIHLMTPTEYCGKFESDINELLYELFTSWGMRWR